MSRLLPLWLAFAAALVAVARAAVVAPVTPHGPPMSPAVVTSAAYLSTETDVLDTAGWMRVLYGVHFDEDERRCAAKDEVLFRPLRQCFVLFRRGPCARKEWLVFDKQKAARGMLTVTCAPRPCAPEWGLDAGSGTCFRHTKCVSPLAFHYTLFGEGVCRCNGTTGGLKNAPPDDPASCLELYRRTPCPKGQMLAPRYRLIEGMDAMCFRDPCAGYKPPPDWNVSPPTATPTTTSATLVMGRPVHAHPHDHHDDHQHDHHGDHQHDHHGDHRPNHPHPNGWRGNSEPDERPVWRSLQAGGSVPSQPHGSDSAGPTGEGADGEGEFDVEVIGGPARPNLGVRTSTRAVIGSTSNNNKPSVLTHDHGSWSGRDVPSGWSDHDDGDWSGPDHDDWRSSDHEQGSFRGAESSRVQHTRPLNFTISLKPLPLDAVRRARRQLAASAWSESRATRNARGEPNSRVDSPGGGSYNHNPRGGPNAGGVAAAPRRKQIQDEATQPRGRELRERSTVTNATDDYALEVQYSDGNRSCMSPSQLNVVCDLQMVPLFSDFSDVKVPICVNALFRFAIGRVGKSDECAENDKGECAKKVVVKSAEPLDWELE